MIIYKNQIEKLENFGGILPLSNICFSFWPLVTNIITKTLTGGQRAIITEGAFITEFTVFDITTSKI